MRDWLRRHWRRDREFVVWLAVLLVIVLVVAIGPLLLPSAYAQAPANRLQPPSPEHLLGTDGYGRDVLSRVVEAGRTSLLLALVIALLATIVGSAIGLISGFYTKSSAVLMRAMDALMAFPGIVLSIALVAAIGSGALSEIVALSVVFTPYMARISRSRAMSLAGRGYVLAARSAGVSGPRILLTHVLPNAMPTILVQSLLIFAAALLLDGTLSFLGMGVQPPTPTWGNMIAEARPFLSLAPTFVIAPGLAIVLTVVTLNAISNGLRGIVDPRARALATMMAMRQRGRVATRARG